MLTAEHPDYKRGHRKYEMECNNCPILCEHMAHHAQVLSDRAALLGPQASLRELMRYTQDVSEFVKVLEVRFNG